MKCKVLLAIGILMVSAPIVYADEQMKPLAISGGWIAMAHSQSALATPDVCVVLNPKSGIGFRSDGDTVEFRVINEQWSLPTDTKGSVTVTIGTIIKTYDISSNTNDAISIELPDQDASLIFGAMDKSVAISVVVGKAKPVSASLAGSTKATNAFRTCAGIHSDSTSPSANPFK